MKREMLDISIFTYFNFYYTLPLINNHKFHKIPIYCDIQLAREMVKNGKNYFLPYKIEYKMGVFSPFKSVKW